MNIIRKRLEADRSYVNEFSFALGLAAHWRVNSSSKRASMNRIRANGIMSITYVGSKTWSSIWLVAKKDGDVIQPGICLTTARRLL